MKIHGDSQSGNCLKVRYTADYLDLPYDWIDVDISRGDTRAPALLALNPAGQIPVVELDDGRVITESNAIIRYLARGASLLPGDAYDQAKIDEWLFWEQYSHEPYIAVCRFQMRYQNQPRESREPWRVKRGERALDHMDRHLGETQWLTAAGFTIADISLLAYTRLAAEGGFELTTRRNVSRWIADCEGELAGVPL